MRIVVTGGEGFIGRNLRVRLAELGFEHVTSVSRSTPEFELRRALSDAEFVFHLAGVNRPKDPGEFDVGNRALTASVCDALRSAGRRVPIVFASSTQALLDNPYGKSKRDAELEIEKYAADTGAPFFRFRLTNVFGKWSRPEYNSAVATFCHNIARGLPITVNNAAAPLRLVYIDDVVDAMIAVLGDSSDASTDIEAGPIYEATVGAVAQLIQSFADSRATRLIPGVGVGLTRALYATYVSFLPTEQFAYPLVRHGDPRGVFAEMMRTPDAGQFSFFTARPGVTRGGHYHHTKTERFLVLQGQARFGFRHIMTNERHELLVSGEESRVVETVPGWAHDVTNVGHDEMIVMLWANENFDPDKPDTVAAPVLD
jgi:UDP-2-acetamido-2,6-beta-L-arabino-hexul-4-ose reductase